MNTLPYHRPTRRRFGLTLTAVTFAVLGCIGYPTPAQAQDLGFPDTASTEQMLADQLDAMAWMIFGREGEPRPDQLERAKVLLDMAAELAPDDEGMWQLRAALARAMQDQPMLIDSLRNYLRLEKHDDAAQLDMIKAMLSGVESLDNYLESLEKLLRAESADQLSAPLRSRLATLAAQAAQEIGDSSRSAAWLGYAVKLDPVNPEAAGMVYQLVLDREGTPRQQGTALINLLRANPVDPNVRIGLANLLMQQAVYAQAADQFNVAMGLADMQTRLELLSPYALCLIASGQEDQVPQLLLELQLFLKQMADAQDPDLAAEPQPDEPETLSLDDLPPLPTTLEFARMILMSGENPVAATASFQRLRESASAIQEAQDREDSLRQLVWVAAVFDQDTDWVRQQIASQNDPEDDIARLAAGWLALRSGDTLTARDTFESLGEDNMFARLGLASLPDLTEKQRADAYQQIVLDDPGSMGAIVAARRLHKMAKVVSPTGEGVPIRVLADSLPRQLWTPALTVSPWLRMNLAVSPGSFGYLQPMKGHVTIRNATRVPLSVGPGGAVQSALMVICSPSIRSEPMGRLQPTFFNMGRRLTLQPGASIEADIRLDRFDLGQLTAIYPNATITFSATAMLDPRPLPNGGVVPGPLGTISNVGSLQARGQPATPNNLQLWIKDLDSTDRAVRAIAIARLLVIARQPAESTEAQDFRAKVSDLVSQRFPSYDPVMQAWTVRFMLPDEDGERVARRVIDLAQRSDDPMVRIVYLVMNADSPTSPALTDAIRHDNPTVRAFAQAMKLGLEKDAERQRELEEGQDPAAETPPASADPFAPSVPLDVTPKLDDPWMP
jgi:tetratricopeptide (TPR) repeat protein